MHGHACNAPAAFCDAQGGHAIRQNRQRPIDAASVHAIASASSAQASPLPRACRGSSGEAHACTAHAEWLVERDNVRPMKALRASQRPSRLLCLELRLCQAIAEARRMESAALINALSSCGCRTPGPEAQSHAIYAHSHEHATLPRSQARRAAGRPLPAGAASACTCTACLTLTRMPCRSRLHRCCPRSRLRATCASRVGSGACSDRARARARAALRRHVTTRTRQRRLYRSSATCCTRRSPPPTGHRP